MSLFGGVIPITGLTFLVFCVFAILAVGYSIGRITIKGISLGSAGVFLVAMIFGCFFYDHLNEQLGGNAKNYLKVVENIGLILFVTSVGFIAGPKFFGNLKKNFKSYILLGLIIILSGALTTVACIMIGRALGEPDQQRFTALSAGLLSGALTSTPAFSAAKATVAPEYEDLVAVGNGIAYIYGVIGVVLFVQLMPKIVKANMSEELRILAESQQSTSTKAPYTGKLIEMDEFGIMAFSLASILGIVLGMIKVPLSAEGLAGKTFSLTTTGGCLMVALVFGHFKRVGTISIMPPDKTLKVFREFGLVLFLLGAGVAGGASFVENFQVIYFFYGIAITTLPMILGYIFARKVLKLNILNTLGSITGGMTSTPALGTLIRVAGTEDVAAAYAATYPIALISVVLAAQFVILLF